MNDVAVKDENMYLHGNGLVGLHISRRLRRSQTARAHTKGRGILYEGHLRERFRKHSRRALLAAKFEATHFKADQVVKMADQAPAVAMGGLVNLGLTCYANAVIQALRHCRKIPWIFEEGRYNTLYKKDANEKRGRHQVLTRALADVVQKIGQCQKGQSVRPGEFWLRLKPCVEDTCYEHFASRAPHDAHEFLMFLLDTIHEATAQEVEMRITRPSAKNEEEGLIHSALDAWRKEFSNTYSPFVDLFFGSYHITMSCQACGHVSHRWETFNALKGAIPTTNEPYSILQALEAEWKSETIEGYACDKCSPTRTTAIRAFKLWRLPQYLTIVIKRFTPDGRKIRTRIAPMTSSTLSLDSYFSPFTPEKTGVTDYSLRSIVDHHGGAGGGHYTAQCKHLTDNTWFLYDDESVHPMNAPHFGESTYVLIFDRVTQSHSATPA